MNLIKVDGEIKVKNQKLEESEGKGIALQRGIGRNEDRNGEEVETKLKGGKFQERRQRESIGYGLRNTKKRKGKERERRRKQRERNGGERDNIKKGGKFQGWVQ